MHTALAIVEIMSLEQTWDEVGQRTCRFDVGQAKRTVEDAESFNLPFAQIKQRQISKQGLTHRRGTLV